MCIRYPPISSLQHAKLTHAGQRLYKLIQVGMRTEVTQLAVRLGTLRSCQLLKYNEVK